ATVPRTYRSVAHRARIAARLRYLERVSSRLRGRAATARNRRDRIAGELESHDPDAMESLRAGYRKRGKRASIGAPARRMRVDAAPAYLTRAAVTHDEVPAVPAGQTMHPLKAANTNLFTLPYGDVADAIVEALLGPDTVRLRTAAATLRSARRLLAHRGAAIRRERVRRLRGEV
ncbi:MAG: hypothetical protein ABEK12_02970, partial [Candidatus Nanohaloarchaea archaeon]